MRRVLAYALIVIAVMSGPVSAADEDESGGMLVNLLESTLSSDTRYIKVSGLEGALSAKATIKEIAVSDEDGVWLTISDAVLDWNRLALVRGRFSVNALTAARIEISRKPKPIPADPTVPTPETQPFALPELPVSIEIGEISVASLTLGQPVLGLAAELKMTGSVTLADGTLESGLRAARLDRPGDRLDLTAKFENETRLITLDLLLTEAAGGLVSTVLKIPGAPSVRLAAKGEGPVGDFAAEISLASDGVERVSGLVSLTGVAAPGAAAEAPKSIAFNADLSGDLSPLLAPEYHAFFGTETALRLVGQSDPDGRLEIRDFDLHSDALSLRGAVDIAASGAVERAVLDGRIAPKDGADVVLPVAGARTRIKSADLAAHVDLAQGETWDLTTTVEGFSRPDLTLNRAEITGRGTLDQRAGLRLTGAVVAGLSGLDFADAALREAVGTSVALDGDFAVDGTGLLKLSGFEVRGADYTAQVDGDLDGLDSGYQMQGTARIGATDLSRFSGLAGRPLGGGVTAQVTGSGSPLGGGFDIAFDARAQDLSSGIEQVDAVIGGVTTIALKAVRDETGLQIDAFQLEGAALSAQARGAVRSQGTTLTFQAALDDLARVMTSVSGPLSLAGDVAQTDGQWGGAVRVQGPQTSFADLKGTLAPDGTADLVYEAQLDRLERFVPEISGSLTSRGTAHRARSQWTIDSTAEGPADISARVAGTFDEETGFADLTAKGKLQLGAVNKLIKPNSVDGIAQFDLAVTGAPSVEAVSGTITTDGTTVVIPGASQTISNLNTTVTVGDGSAQVLVNAALRDGGGVRVSGPVSMAAPFDARLTAELQQVILTDNISFDSSANGQLVYAGPLTGDGTVSGEVVFGETNINIAATSGSVGAAPIPVITHRGESAAGRATRDRAGLIVPPSTSAGPAIGLDIRLIAQNRVFARGRGLQAELGGDILVRGTTANVVPSGQIELIRGNFDLLGRKLALTDGRISLQGKLQPYLEFVATTSTSDGQATLQISGPLDAPEVEVFSVPERPTEEALAMLIFGNRFSDLSPFKIAQLALQIAKLNGTTGGATEKARSEAGVDELNVGTDSGGAGALGVGGYVSDKVYTDVTVNTRGESELNLNLDVTDNLTVKGKVDNSGETGIGIFFERDY